MFMRMIKQFKQGGAERREHLRIYGPQLSLEFDGVRRKTRDWSLGGFLVESPVQHALGDRIEGEVQMPWGGQSGRFVAEVVRFADGNMIGARWIEISPLVFLSMSGGK